MKRTTTKLTLKRRLELIRTTVRELTPAQLEQVQGGGEIASSACQSKCCDAMSY
jgi:hypothetical protein